MECDACDRDGMASEESVVDHKRCLKRITEEPFGTDMRHAWGDESYVLTWASRRS
jgi:hypothetical protein